MSDDQEGKDASNWWWRGLVMIALVAALVWAATRMSWYLAGSPAGSLEEAARGVLKKYGAGANEQMTFRERPSQSTDPTIRSVMFEDERGEVRYKLDLKPVGGGRWAEMRYEKIDGK